MAGKEYTYLTTEVDVLTGEKPENKGDSLPTKRVAPGMLSDSGLTDEQIAKLPFGATRPATAEEIESAQNSAKARNAAKIAADAEAQRQQDEIVRANEKKNITAEAEAQKQTQIADAEQRHETERAAQAADTTAKLNEVQAPDATTKTRRTKDNG